jgi:hypothetical protein
LYGGDCGDADWPDEEWGEGEGEGEDEVGGAAAAESGAAAAAAAARDAGASAFAEALAVLVECMGVPDDYGTRSALHTYGAGGRDLAAAVEALLSGRAATAEDHRPGSGPGPGPGMDDGSGGGGGDGSVSGGDDGRAYREAGLGFGARGSRGGGDGEGHPVGGHGGSSTDIVDGDPCGGPCTAAWLSGELAAAGAGGEADDYASYLISVLAQLAADCPATHDGCGGGGYGGGGGHGSGSGPPLLDAAGALAALLGDLLPGAGEGRCQSLAFDAASLFFARPPPGT